MEGACRDGWRPGWRCPQGNCARVALHGWSDAVGVVGCGGGLRAGAPVFKHDQ